NNPHLPRETLNVLRRAGSTSDLSGFGVCDLTLPPEVLARLARGGEWARRLAARHPGTPADALRTLAGDSLLFIRQEVARHPSTPSDVLHLLLEDERAEVREVA